MYGNIIETEEVRINKGKRCYFQLLSFLAFVKSYKRYVFTIRHCWPFASSLESFWRSVENLKRNETRRYQSAWMRSNRTRPIVVAWSLFPKLKGNTITRVILVTCTVIPDRVPLLCSQSNDQYVCELLYGSLMIITW